LDTLLVTFKDIALKNKSSCHVCRFQKSL